VHKAGGLKVGLVGCGRIAELVHLNVLAQLADVELIAFAEVDPERREQVLRRAPKAIACASYQELIQAPELDAVVICLPPALHAQAAIAAFEKGKHVYLEKPLATNLNDARHVLAAWNKAKTVGMIGFNYRLNPLFRKMREHVESGKLGPLIGVCSIFSTAAKAMPGWKRTRSEGGGVLLDLASHHLDLLRFFFQQEIREVCAELESYSSDDDCAMLHLKLADGLSVQSFFSFTAIEEDRFEIFGQKGRLSVDRYRSVAVECTEAGQEFSLVHRTRRGFAQLIGSGYRIRRHFAIGHEPSYREALYAFVSAVNGAAEIKPDLDDAYCCLEIVDAAECSARERRVIRVNDREKR
jgi:predicted dehydrogenase